ncbi:hypothetical protein-signal peptide and transmembrane prediction [Rhodopirellula baltica SH 1]|uniref:Uncharacterized protein n=1 Tax=Rhodopirellula baltica (strain DSM 10527 / NCIMB 13988 / SH1) TaxID=243090 RepID=Q7UTV7_RHOBA|nr:hypothetical protein-signal peptide and transmembrane prediction [Rhodopirellula baltica SH 1]
MTVFFFHISLLCQFALVADEPAELCPTKRQRSPKNPADALKLSGQNAPNGCYRNRFRRR